MKRIGLVVLSLLLAPPLFADAGQRLIPAGSLVSCTSGDARISSKTTAVGDPVLCKVTHRRGDFMLPYGSYLGGEFAEFKDPGHLVGKGFMELEFDRLYVGNTVVPINAKVVDVPGYRIDSQGRILGKGHPVRDTITWMIPILWPIDLINLPRRGPRPTLKTETALTLRVMEDIEVPVTSGPQRDPYGLIPRGQGSYAPAPPPTEDQQPGPEMSYEPPQPPMPPPQPAYPTQPVMAYAVPTAYVPVVVAPPVIYAGYVVGPGIPVMAYAPYYAPPQPVVGYGYRGYVGARAYGYGYPGRNYVAARYVAPSYGMPGPGGYGYRP